ncbi:MAG: dipicolinate synthase subunit B [Clostridia bacterium]|nr:dipicolinate synthase subunit B [Clostridia bacterium]
MIGYAFCGSFCTLESSLRTLEKIKLCGEEIIPIMSERCAATDTRFGKAEYFISRAEAICGNKTVRTVEEAERFGSIAPLDYLIISPCTGNTLAKLAAGITDGVVTMAAKAHLRCDRPLLIALSTNDAMSQNLKNIGTLLSRKSVYFAPMLQDDPQKKPHSLVAREELIKEAYLAMKNNRQLRPIFL